MKETRYYKWLLKSKKTQAEFKDWLIRNNADIYEGSGLLYGEVIKFKLNKEVHTLWITGYASVGFIKVMNQFLNISK